MGILRAIRIRFGADATDAEALTRALGELNGRINKNRVDAAAVEVSIPGAVIASIDAAATERRKLQALDSEHAALVKASLSVRREIETVRKRDADIELDERWDIFAKCYAEVVKNSNDCDALSGMSAVALNKLRDSIEAAERVMPVRAPDYQAALSSNALSIWEAELHARMQDPLPHGEPPKSYHWRHSGARRRITEHRGTIDTAFRPAGRFIARTGARPDSRIAAR